MQRGCVSTLAASTKMARERSAGSEMAANADGGCKVLESCAEVETDTAPAMQHSNATTDPARMRPHASDREITFPSGKSSHGETMHPNATSLTGLRCIGPPRGIDLFLSWTELSFCSWDIRLPPFVLLRSRPWHGAQHSC